MAGRTYGGRRRYPVHPTTAARREREREEQQRFEWNRTRLHRLLRQFRRFPLYGDEAQEAWRQPEIRSFATHRDSGGTLLQTIIRRGPRGELFLQEPHFPGWRFSRLVPRFATPRESEIERER
jgi:hypothetical protein